MQSIAPWCDPMHRRTRSPLTCLAVDHDDSLHLEAVLQADEQLLGAVAGRLALLHCGGESDKTPVQHLPCGLRQVRDAAPLCLRVLGQMPMDTEIP